jgi:amidohydrolase
MKWSREPQGRPGAGAPRPEATFMKEKPMTREELKHRVDEAIERHADEIVAVGEAIRRHPELGFKELRTSALVEAKFRQLGLAPRTGLAITGVRADAAGGAGPGPTFALVGELDALVVAGHPEADRSTGAVHACGHNAQIAGLVGAAIGLVRARAMDRLAGRVAFMAVPAEEGGDLEWRLNEVRAGRLEFLGGKCELLRLGHLDDVDLAMMIHTTPRPEDGLACVPGSNNGRFGKTARFVGRAAHAGGAPHMGVNALYAAHLALAAINALRETFRDEDTIRVHPILTHGGSQVNVIPGEARLETYVRGRTLEGIRDANAKVDRALRAGALALGASVEIETLPGYLPLRSDPTMTRVFRQNADTLFGPGACREAGHRAGSTDMGDLSQVIPVLHPYMGGARGTGHAADYEIVDPHLAYVMPARALAAMVVDLLWDGAGGAREVIANALPGMTRQGYVEFQRSVRRREVFRGDA